jgi:hypothetical protein
LISSSALWAAALLIPWLIGGFWFLLAADPAESALPLAAVLAVTAAVGVTWQLSRARARRRLQTALDAYVERQIAHRARRKKQGAGAAIRSSAR